MFVEAYSDSGSAIDTVKDWLTYKLCRFFIVAAHVQSPSLAGLLAGGAGGVLGGVFGKTFLGISGLTFNPSLMLFLSTSSMLSLSRLIFFLRLI